MFSIQVFHLFFVFSFHLINFFLANRVWKHYFPSGLGPSVRAMASMTYNPQTRKIYIFAGAMSKRVESNDVSGFCDIYELDVGIRSIFSFIFF